MPRKIRQLIKDYKKEGFSLVKGAGKGDHAKWFHQASNTTRILDGQPGDDAKPYQEKQLKEALERAEEAQS